MIEGSVDWAAARRGRATSLLLELNREFHAGADPPDREGEFNERSNP